uniref:ATP synthase complex subunit 8 n=2 Tax=Hyalella TaxID=199487 RepID=A0A7T8ZSA0_9CRUS|nr:ATP synthase F0 subunit 8 [Hyalella solida]QQQ88649.1 ATP synthase F0 subunit 8 [Hyalella tiwanaku]
MPQMAPMLWFILFFYFILLAVILMNLVFFDPLCNNNLKNSSKELIKLNWKW